MKKHKKTKKNQKKQLKFLGFVKKNKVLVITTAIILLIILFSFGAKIFLLMNFLLGNDIVVKLNVDKEFLSLVHGQEEKINFEASVMTNPFCTASCKSTFTDISTGTIIEQEQFTLKPTIRLYKKHTIKADRLGTGLELYRFSLECNSKRTFLCHTDEETTIRNILVTVEYDLNDEDKKLKDTLKRDIELVANNLGKNYGKKKFFQDVIDSLNKTVIIEELNMDIDKMEKRLNDHLEKIQKAGDLWKKQDYSLTETEIEKLNKEIIETENQLMKLNKSLLSVIYPYNVLVGELGKIKEQLDQFRILAIVNQEMALEINDTIKEFNSVMAKFRQKDYLEKKKILVSDIADKTEELKPEINYKIREETLKRQLELDVAYDALCGVTGLCISNSSIEERANQAVFDLNITCSDIEKLNEKLNLLNKSMHNAFVNENYPDTEDFWHNISLKVENIKQNIIRDYLERLPADGNNTKIIRSLLVRHDFYETGNYLGYNLTPALTTELVKQEPKSCYNPDSNIETANELNINKIKINETVPIPIEISLDEPVPKCCLFAKCFECCITEECEYKNLPVVFLHGHAFNKDLSAEYSLDAFNKIQEKLEDDNYLNAGAISLYTELEASQGIWKQIPAPLTIKASYYFDIFHEPENYIVVQTKSENIDTYAVRLKELIDAIQYKTGKPKIIIIAHSMGGLVARRYIQIFGQDKVEKLILITTPNKGIVGNIADYCPLVGEKLECRDMNADSLFMNKLKREKQPDIPIYNIIGTGCNMEHTKGDGIVLEKNAMLDGAKNFIINGTCKRLEPLHTELLDIDKYPETYFVIKEALKI